LTRPTVLSILSVFILLGVLACSRVVDLDIWWHLKTGEYIVNHKSLPTAAEFNYALPSQEWINIGWIFDVCAYAAYKVAGIPAVQVLKITVILSSFLLILLLLIKFYGGIQWYTTLILLLAVIAGSVRLQPRPEAVSFLFITLFWYILESYRRKELTGNKVYFLAAVPVIEMVWANVHPFYAIGIIIAGIYLFSAVVQKVVKFSGYDTETDTRSIVVFTSIFIASALIVMLNPYGVRIYETFLSYFSIILGNGKVVPETVSELMSPWSKMFSGDLFVIAYKTLAIAGVASFFFTRRRVSIVNLLLFLMFFVLSLKYMRNTGIFALIAAVIINNNVSKDSIVPGIIGKCVCCIVIITSITVSWLFLTRRLYDDVAGFGLGVKPYFFLTHACEAVKTQKLPGRVYNDYNTGGYLLWSIVPEYTVFLDGRMDFTAEDTAKVLNRYFGIQQSPVEFDRVSKSYGVNTAVIDYKIPGNEKLVRYLWDSDGWTAVFLDYTGIIFTRRNKGEKGNSALISAVAGTLVDGKAVERRLERNSLLRKLGVVDTVVEYRQVFDLCYNLGEYVLAEKVALAALRINPRKYELLANLGAIYAEQNNYSSAKKVLTRAGKVNPGYSYTFYNLGCIAAQEKDYDTAEKMFIRATKGTPYMPSAYQALNAVYELKKTGRSTVSP